jgi:hypothetical protein
VGFTEPARSPASLVSSYLTVSPLPTLRPAVCFLWHWSVGLPPLAVSQHPALRSPDFPPAVSFMRYRTSTSSLSTRWSSRGPYSIKDGRSNLEAESQRIVAQRPLSRVQYPVHGLSRLQRIRPSKDLNLNSTSPHKNF